MKSDRVHTLAEIAEHSDNTEVFWLYLRDFLDGFYPKPSPSAMAEPPELLAGRLPHGDRLDAYLAAVAEHLATTSDHPAPAWTHDSKRRLPEPYFAFDTHEGRMFLLVESPTAFRSRNLFVSADALARV